MNLEVSFANHQQREFYYSAARNQCFSGGFNNGKTWSACLKGFTLASTFPNYRLAICRQTYADLKKTTMETFFKLCPSDMVRSHNGQDGLTILKNDSKIYWMHLDKVDLSTLRGFEVNTVIIDQAEETKEEVYDVMDARIGRWDNAIIPEKLLRMYRNEFGHDWPKSPKGLYLAPSYMMLLCNPDTQFHYIYRKYHPDSLERIPGYFYVEGQWDANLGSEETFANALKKGDEWVGKYVKGIWGVSNVQIHRIPSQAMIPYDKDLFERIKKKGNLCRILDHGDASPTCCLWVAALDNIFIVYREYYIPKELISAHRANIHDLSEGESYSSNYADPSIFKRASQKEGGFWSVADEYLTTNITAPAITWIPADNNEFATRNRINECLAESVDNIHPVSKQSPAVKLYFLKRSLEYPNGCYHVINETQSQRRKLLGYVDGKAIYSDDREDSIADHSYDCLRYYVAMHGLSRKEPSRKPPPMSMKWFQAMKKRREGILLPNSV